MRTDSFEQLKARLLSIGGERVVSDPEADFNLLLERGRPFETKGRKLVSGEQHRCPGNVALHFIRHHHLACGGTCEIVTGYGLNNGTWFPHSWLWDGSRVVEVNPSYEHYFGIILNQVEATGWVMMTLTKILPVPQGHRMVVKRVWPGVVSPRKQNDP